MRAPRILVVDNYDSFTYNLVQYIGELGGLPDVHRNDALAVDDRRFEDADGILLSPGPGKPDGAGISLEVVRRYSGRKPLLGVCLGHQCLGQAFGGQIRRAERIMHGKTSNILHSGNGAFAELPNPFEATRYHSLLIEPASLPAVLEVNAHTSDGEIMGIRHRSHPSWGVQFHPESILTTGGHQIIRNFLELSVHGADDG